MAAATRPSLGAIRLAKIWLPECEEYCADILRNGEETGATRTKLNYRSLQTILAAPDLDVKLLGTARFKQAERLLSALKERFPRITMLRRGNLICPSWFSRN